MEYSLYQVCKDFASPIVAGIALTVGYMQLRNWKNQLIGSQEHELAKRILIKALKSRNALKMARSPFIPVQEMTLSKEDQENLVTFEEKRNQGTLNAINARLQRCREPFMELDDLMVEAEVIWGKEVAEISKEFLNLYNKLYSFLESFIVKERYRSPEDYQITDTEIENALKPIEEYFKKKFIRA